MKNQILVAIATALVSLQGLAADVRITLPGGGALVLPAPDGWRETKQPGGIPTVSLSPKVAGAMQVLVSPLVRPDGTFAPADKESLRRLVGSGAQGALPQAVEKSLPVQELRGPNVQGSYFSATDRAPKPGEFRSMTQGAMVVQGLPVSFTILSNGDARPAIESAFRMFEAARREQ